MIERPPDVQRYTPYADVAASWPAPVALWVESKRGNTWGVERLDGVAGFVRVTKAASDSEVINRLHARRLARALNRAFRVADLSSLPD